MINLLIRLSKNSAKFVEESEFDESFANRTEIKTQKAKSIKQSDEVLMK